MPSILEKYWKQLQDKVSKGYLMSYYGGLRYADVSLITTVVPPLRPATSLERLLFLSRQTNNPYVDFYLSLSSTATSLKQPLSSAPKVAIVEKFNCILNWLLTDWIFPKVFLIHEEFEQQVHASDKLQYQQEEWRSLSAKLWWNCLPGTQMVFHF